MEEDFIKREARLAALETIVCQHLAVLYRMQPEFLDVVKQQALDAARTRAFPGLDPAYSDLVSAEFEAALRELYSAIEKHVNDLQTRRPR
jgi:hypothetical protein